MKDTRYLPLDKACGPHLRSSVRPSVFLEFAPVICAGSMRQGCAFLALVGARPALHRIAPTTHDDEGNANPSANPHFDMLTRGTVHDPTTRRMGGVAGHAGVFSTAHDISLFAQALLDKLTHNTGPFPLKQSTLQLMTQPEQPSTTGSTAFNSDLFTASSSAPPTRRRPTQSPME